MQFLLILYSNSSGIQMEIVPVTCSITSSNTYGFLMRRLKVESCCSQVCFSKLHRTVAT